MTVKCHLLNLFLEVIFGNKNLFKTGYSFQLS